MSWSTQDVPDLTGRLAVVTGVTGGLGHHTALELGRAGADLVVTARNAQKAETTVARLRAELPTTSIETLSLDLAELADVERAAAELADRFEKIDVLVNNAGIMIPPYSTTADGFELQIGTNHLGHFAWTARLWPLLRAADARVVSVASNAHTMVQGLDLASLTPQGAQRRYKRWQSYGESKLANVLFFLELDRRVKRAGLGVVSVGAHPGYASTELTKTGIGMGNRLAGSALTQISRVVAQSAAAGAQPSIRAATDPAFVGGEYVGPSGPGHWRGRPVLHGVTRTGRDEGLAEAVWTASEQATGVDFTVA